MENTTKPQNKTYVLLGLLLLIMILSLVLKYKGGIKGDRKFSSENVTVENIDQSMQGVSKLPVGFPKDTPVELENIIEGTTLTYPDRKVTLYNVSYFSNKQQEEVFALFGKYLKDNGYTISVTDKTASKMMYKATKENNEMNVVITPQASRLNVLVSFVVR